MTNYIVPINDPYYYFLKVVTNTDTLLGYLHFKSNGSGLGTILAYAIEGSDSTIIISSVNDVSPSNISIYPNPFTNQINIITEKPFEYEIADYMGRAVLSGKSDKIINTAQLSAGGYFLILKSEEILSVKKIVKLE